MALLDWTSNGPNGSAGVLETPKPCGDCGNPTFLLEPVTRKPRHKVCAEVNLDARVDAIMGRSSIVESAATSAVPAPARRSLVGASAASPLPSETGERPDA